MQKNGFVRTIDFKMSEALQPSIKELVENKKTTVPILRQILDYYRKQRSDLRQPKRKKELVQLLRRCLADNNLKHIKSCEKHGAELIFISAVDSKSDSDSNSNSKAEAKPTTGETKNKANLPIRGINTRKPTKQISSKTAKTTENGAQSESETKKRGTCRFELFKLRVTYLTYLFSDIYRSFDLPSSR